MASSNPMLLALQKVREEERSKKQPTSKSSPPITSLFATPPPAMSKSDEPTDDPYDLSSRFCLEQQQCYSRALSEIMQGQKRSCWMWFVLPTAPWVVNGVERGSGTNKSYALRDLPPNELSGDNAARAYLKYNDLGVNLRENYLEIVTEIAVQLEKGIGLKQLMGFLDAPKLVSSVELFHNASSNGVDEEVHVACSRVLKCCSKKRRSHADEER